MRWVGSAGSIITNPDGTYGLFLSGAWAADGDSDAFNQIFYSQSSTGERWSVPRMVVSTDYTFSASEKQDAALAGGQDTPLTVSAYYEGRAYGPSVVQNANGTLTMVFAGYRLPKTIANAGTSVGTGYGGAPPWTIGATDPALYRNILTVTLQPWASTETTVTATPPNPVIGQPVTLSATVTSSSGTPATGGVSFAGDGGPLCTATLDAASPDIATCRTTYTALGSDSVTASYGGDATHFSSASPTPATVTVGQDATSTVATSSANPAVTGQLVTLSATVSVNGPGAGTPTGSVAFAGQGGPLCTGTLDAASPDVASCSVTYPGATTDDVTATYAGDTDDVGSSSVSYPLAVDPDPTTTSFTFAPTAPVAGQPVTFTATVAANAPGSGTPSGTVAFAGANGTLCTATLSGGSPNTATCAATYSGATTDDVTATYRGDGNYASSGAASTVTVGQAATGTTLAFSPFAPIVGQPVTITATVAALPPGAGTPTGSVAFTGNGGPICAAEPLGAKTPDVATCTTTYTSTTTDDVTAAYAGDANFSGSSASSSVTVGQDSTTTSVTPSVPSPVVGQPVTYTATIAVTSPGSGTPTGSVTFTGNGGPICAAAPLDAKTPDVATCTTTYAGPTTDDVTATYAGDANDVGSFGTTSIAVSQDGTTTTVSVSPSSAVVGQTITLMATVAAASPGSGTPTGSVTFTGNGGPICAPAPLSGTIATCTTTYAVATTDHVTASYGGDDDFTSSAGTATVSVGKAATSTTLAVSPSSAVVGQTITLTATVTPTAPGAGTPTGSVTFDGTGGPLCNGTLSGGTATCTMSYGKPTTDKVNATYGGSAGFTGSSSGPSPVTVVKAQTATTVTSSANPAVTGQPVTFTATVGATAPGGGTPTGTVTFALTDPAPTKGSGHLPALACQGGDTRSLSSGTAACVVAGGLVVAQSPATVTAAYAGSASYGASTAGPFVQRVGQDGSTVTISARTDPTTTGAGASFSAVVAAAAPGAGGPTGTVTWRITGASGGRVPCWTTDDTVNPTTGKVTCSVGPGELSAADGPYTVSVAYGGDANFTGSTGTFTQQITKAASWTSISVTGPVASGQPASITATVTGVPASAGTPTGTVTFSIVGASGPAVACVDGDAVPLRRGTATCRVPSGFVTAGSPYTVSAAYGGDANFTASSSASKTVKVKK